LKVKYRLEWERENRGRDSQLRTSAVANIPVFLKDDNWLSNNDWVALGHLETILTSFESVLKKVEGDGRIRHHASGFHGSYGNVWDVMPSYEFLLKQLEDTRRVANRIPDPIQFQVGVNAACDKLNEYYR